MPPKILDRHTLKSWLLADPATDAFRPTSFAIIDVRDDDYAGGHIKTSRHHPSSSFATGLPYLHAELQKFPVLVFHCALSQQRGPAAASMYMRYKDMTGPHKTPGSEYADQKTGPEQEVYVLKGGFTEWQREFGKDERLTEDYDEGYWKYF
ncbi:Rhodanese-like domain-containing protein [Lipomyces tetrasporus]|uniref:Rhodanese-like domain-containing protein n=1 Tax=Lipomyces tetrasporus TaxID=54092 RepID=A0AAD7QX81_9ASCO|nr:Rhodanese-like domain-containing protein [Lipomyces tetrasporus]KAJ8102916.1 Rhodanese-like domain-containing protein [Lipomyces tetrasporus]